MTKSSSHLPEYGHTFFGREEHMGLEKQIFQVPISASKVVFGGVSHLFLLRILFPESHTVGLVQPDSMLSYFGVTLL